MVTKKSYQRFRPEKYFVQLFPPFSFSGARSLFLSLLQEVPPFQPFPHLLHRRVSSFFPQNRGDSCHPSIFFAVSFNLNEPTDLAPAVGVHQSPRLHRDSIRILFLEQAD